MTIFKKSQSITRIVGALEKDLDGGAIIIQGGLLYADDLISQSARSAVDASGRVHLHGHSAEDIVMLAVDQILSGERRVYSLRGGLHGTVRRIVIHLRRGRPVGTLRDEISDALYRSRDVHNPLAILSVLGSDPDLWGVAEALLAGKKSRQIAKEQGLPLRIALSRITRVNRIAKGA